MSGAYLIGLGGTISMHQTAQGAVPVTGAVELSETVAGFSGAESPHWSVVPRSTSTCWNVSSPGLANWLPTELTASS